MSVTEEPSAPDSCELRLLPWTAPDGKPCYLSTDNHDSRLSRLADDVEATQLGSGDHVLVGARAVLADAKAGEYAVRFALTRATESLEDVLRIAVSRGERIEAGDR
ncbi:MULTISPECIES: hypothetical protein [unclassified Streptomyces]|uniref:hypothetical protein n=1 Tax=unclassified Streptomyces TaxID=2593676 RepID=UPI0023653235|nr:MULTISPECIES: hypothetical protein [unclassified Streptomyces]MDF3142889.1 hypothetical protein [Streptomyces sp. T21Q-yed]WDF39302.1 hypothetical protein PBV52_22095 [Streptomyces sp. T12]